MTEPASETRPRVALLADDLIWATRLHALVAEAGGEPVATREAGGFARAADAAAFAVVDATARAYDPLAAVRVASAAGLRVICVAQHDDAAFRAAAREAGAEKVVPYRLMAERGAETLRAWLTEERS